MSNLYYKNLPDIRNDKHAAAIEISTDRSLRPFLNYYYNYLRHESERVIEFQLRLLDWKDFWLENDLEKEEKLFIQTVKNKAQPEPSKLKELRKIAQYYDDTTGIYAIEIKDDKLDDAIVLNHLVNNSRVSRSRSLIFEK
jgi:hypothetical protein